MNNTGNNTFTFYIQGVLKLKNTSGAKRLTLNLPEGQPNEASESSNVACLVENRGGDTGLKSTFTAGVPA